MTSQGSAYSRFQRALSTGNLQLIEAAAVELPKVSLDDALAILIVLTEFLCEHSEEKVGDLLAAHRLVMNGDMDDDIVGERIDDRSRVPALERTDV